MLDSTVRIARRGLAAGLACIAFGSFALTQDMPQGMPIPAVVSPTPTMRAPSALPEPAPRPAAAPKLSEAQLEQLVAPIALYPDPLLAQIMMASTYPLEVVEAARWVAAPTKAALSADALQSALAAQNWDPSVKALTAFPQVLETMSDQLQWTEALGNAFLTEQAGVMAAVQNLRHQAMAAGTLKTTPQCDCVVETNGSTISILPAEPEDIRVPVYGPEVYGDWPYPGYPADEFPAPGGFDTLPGFPIGFESPVDLAFLGPLWGWGSIDWGLPGIVIITHRHARALRRRDVDSRRVWVHNPAHRGAVRYADGEVRERFERARVAALTMAARGVAEKEATRTARMDDAGRLAAISKAAAREWRERVGSVTVLRGASALRDEPASRDEAVLHAMPAFRGPLTVLRGARAAALPHVAFRGPARLPAGSIAFERHPEFRAAAAPRLAPAVPHLAPAMPRGGSFAAHRH
jgi:Protein of unknown function (DUF3300)